MVILSTMGMELDMCTTEMVVAFHWDSGLQALLPSDISEEGRLASTKNKALSHWCNYFYVLLPSTIGR